MQQAADLHRAFCRHLATELCDAADDRSFVITPAKRKSEFAELLPQGWAIEFQSEGDLGRRMRAWFAAKSPRDQTLADGDRSTTGSSVGTTDRVLIGADCPTLGGDTIRQTRRLLGDHDVVLGPAIDGGYYLIALRGGWRSQYATLMDDMPWSSDAVYDATCARAAGAGLSLASLLPMEDVDTISELDRLRVRLCDQMADPRHDALRQAVDRILVRGAES